MMAKLYILTVELPNPGEWEQADFDANHDMVDEAYSTAVNMIRSLYGPDYVLEFQELKVWPTVIAVSVEVST